MKTFLKEVNLREAVKKEGQIIRKDQIKNINNNKNEISVQKVLSEQLSPAGKKVEAISGLEVLSERSFRFRNNDDNNTISRTVTNLFSTNSQSKKNKTRPSSKHSSQKVKQPFPSKVMINCKAAKPKKRQSPVNQAKVIEQQIKNVIKGIKKKSNNLSQSQPFQISGKQITQSRLALNYKGKAQLVMIDESGATNLEMEGLKGHTRNQQQKVSTKDILGETYIHK